MTHEEATKDVLFYLSSQADEYFFERNTTREAVLENSALIDRIAAEHRKCVTQYGCEREWSCKDACDIEPGIMVEQEQKPATMTLWGRLGIALEVTPEELEILQGADRRAGQDLFIQLILSDRCEMYGDTYFPVDANETVLDQSGDELEFDLPRLSLHHGHERTAPHISISGAEMDAMPDRAEARLTGQARTEMRSLDEQIQNSSGRRQKKQSIPENEHGGDQHER